MKIFTTHSLEFRKVKWLSKYSCQDWWGNDMDNNYKLNLDIFQTKYILCKRLKKRSMPVH